jgi:2-oxoglutarate dehydrogenase E1 component
MVISPVSDFTTGTFRPVLPDPVSLNDAAVKRVILTTGKVFYELLAGRQERGVTDTAIVRLEQLYPLPVNEIKAQLARFPNAEDIVWVQEEPANQGAWSFIALNLVEQLDGVPVRRVSRPAAAAPAVGSSKTHDAEQAAIVEAALPRA